METKAKGIPYGVADFEEVRRENFYYVDKTWYLPVLEDENKYLFLIRPRRFGKSLFVSMMRAYYDLSMGIIEEIAATGSVLMTLKTSFPAEYVTDDENFRSLIYYYGLLTMDSLYGNMIRMVIPNKCVKEQYWSFMRNYYDSCYEVDFSALRKEMVQMAFAGDWQPLIRRIATAYKENSSVRDSILGEHNLQGFFKAYLALNPFYLVEPEIELNYGYSDFLLLPDKRRYPDVAHSYILELKYLKQTATDAEVEEKSREADGQLQRYSQDKVVKCLCEGTQLHLLKVIFRGAEITVRGDGH